MKNKNYRIYVGSFSISIVLIVCLVSSFQTGSLKTIKPAPSISSVRKTLDSLYSAFSFESGQEPEWDVIRHLTLNGAAFVSAPTNHSKRFAIHIEEFISDYKSDIIKSGLKKTGYSEHIISADIHKIGNVAAATVIFKAFIKGDNRTRKPGMDNIQLLFDQGRWKIVAFTTQSESTPQ
jgi:hypothetical protein